MSVGDVLDTLGQASLGIFGAGGDKLNNDLIPAKTEKLSAVLERTGWGTATDDLNKRARSIIRREDSSADPKRKSGGGPCSSKGDFAYGWFQICTVNCGTGGSPPCTNGCDTCVKFLQNGENNSRVARALYASRGWQPWASSGGTPEPTDWDPMVTTDKGTLTGTVSDAASAVVSPFASVASAAVNIIGTLLSPDTWFRIGKGGMGFVFVIAGTGALVFIVANKATGGTVARAGKRAATTAITKGV